MRSFITTTVLVAILATFATLSSAMVTQKSFKAAKGELRTLAKQVKNQAQRKEITRAAKRAMRAIRTQGGCKAAVCFALEGSKDIPSTTYDVQKLLTGLVGAVIKTDPRANLGAAQYALSNTAITPIIASGRKFLKAVASSKQSRQGRTNMSAGLAYCWFEARRNSRANKNVVMMGSGKYNIGFNPTFVMKPIELAGGNVVPVVTKGGKAPFATSLGMSKGDVIVANSINKIATALTAIVSDICDVTIA